MQSADRTPLDVGPPTTEERETALDFAWRHLARPERRAQIAKLLGGLATDPDVLAGLLVARRAGVVVGGIWAQLQSGRFAFLSSPHIEDSEPRETAQALLAGLMQLFAQRQVQMVEALLETDHGEDFDRLCAAGFEHFADLLYMVSVERSFPTSLPVHELQFEPFAESETSRLFAVVESTYEGTRDCPQLNGVREMADVIAGYRATGTFDPARWLFVRHAGTDVGCLLLTEHAAHNQWELVYMGLTPAARGRGWGIAAVRHAQWLAQRGRAARLVLAVDADNDPAIRMYAEAGFTAWDRRSVLLRLFSDPAE